MILEKIFENDMFIIYQDNKGFDFAYDIENKTDDKITIQYGEFEETIKIDDWVGLFPSEKYIIDCLMNGNYEIIYH